MQFLAEGSPQTELSDARCAGLVSQLIGQIRSTRTLRRVLILPPDYTRFHSAAGLLTCQLYAQLTAEGVTVEILPALGTHFAMTAEELDSMFPGIPHERFHVHNFRTSIANLGEVPADVLERLSEDRLRGVTAQAQINRMAVEGGWDAVISVGQLVPHEVIGIANQIKNVLVGIGGSDMINKSHWLGAVYGMERIMGRAVSPVRSLLNHAARLFLKDVPLVYLLTVRARNARGELVTRGLFAGDDDECYLTGAELCRAVNLDYLDRAPKKVVVFLDPSEFKSTWLGNKSVYRTRMAIADDGELVVLAPGVKQFGEDPAIDKLIRKYGYRGTPTTLAAVEANADLGGNLSASAHLIHGSSEGRFRITYCPGHLTREETEGVGFGYADLGEMSRKYDPAKLKDGWNDVGGEEVFYVSNPALGLWGTRERFGASAG